MKKLTKKQVQALIRKMDRLAIQIENSKRRVRKIITAKT